MAEKRKTRTLIKEVVIRVFKAALWGLITYLIGYYPTTLVYTFALLPFEYSQLFNVFVMMLVFFAVVTKLFSGTILEYALGIAKALVVMTYFFYVFNGGIINLTIPVSETIVDLVLDLRAVLAMLVFVNLLALTKSFLQAINYVAKRSEPAFGALNEV